jgi:integrase
MRLRSGKGTQLFKEFIPTWYEEMKIGWRDSYDQTVVKILNGRLLKIFGEKEVSEITKADLLQFRARLGEEAGRNGKKMSPSHINRHMYLMRMILREAADRFDFNTPFKGIKALRNNKPDIHPFNLEEVNLIINRVDPWYRYYYTTRFLTGLRTGEIDGLKWKYVDFENRLIKIRESMVKDKQTYTKNDYSQRDIEMSSTVYESLREQFKRSGHLEYVFVNSRGDHLNYHNVSRRVWHPLLIELGLDRRNPYQTRHTAATIWLGAGENPAWIARQMGHSTTEMLFRVYARYVPNLTRKDGSAMDRLLNSTVEVNHDPLPMPKHIEEYITDEPDEGDGFWQQFIDDEGDDLGGVA